MALEVKTESPEQTQQEKSRQESLHKSVLDSLKGDKIQSAILNDLGLSPEVESKPEPKAKTEVKKQIEKKEEETEDESEEDIEEEVETQDQEEESEEDEEVIPKSKVQKRFDELTAKNKQLERQIEEIKATKAQEPKDEVTKQLENMTQEQLKSAKTEVRKAQIKAQNDDNKLNELLALEDKIDSVIQDAPKNFAKAQQEAYAKKANQIAEMGEISEKSIPEILKIAKGIYEEYPDLQKNINGQATALDLAVKHFKAINSAPGDKTKETELKRQNNNLKRKVTLDTKTGKVNADKSKLDALKKNAIGGTMKQKVDLVRTHPMFNVDKMIPDEFKQ